MQNYAKDIVVEELKKKLDTDLGIAQLHFQPFSTIQLDSVYLYGQRHEQILLADKISADIDLLSLLNGKLVFTSARLSDFKVQLSKDSSNAPLNIQYIIDAFKSDKPSSDSKIEVKLSSVGVDNGYFSYDVLDAPSKDGIFDINHIAVSDFTTRLSLKSLTKDSLNIQVRKLKLKEKSGFEITNLTTRLLTHNKQTSVKGFRLDLPSSYIQFDKCEIDFTPSEDESDNILDYATIDCILSPSYIAPRDIAAFVPALKDFKDVLKLETSVQGSIDNFIIDDLILEYGEKMNLLANIEVKDLRRQEDTYILGSIDDLTIQPEGIEGLIDNFSKEKTNLPPAVKNLGTISFIGDISGYLSQLNAFGSVETNAGIVKADILFGFDKKNGLDSYLKGKVYTSNFEIGEMLNQKDLNTTSLSISVELSKPTYSKLKGKAAGTIYDFDYKGYQYKDINIDATYDGMRLEGNLGIHDPNGEVFISGLFDLSDKKQKKLDFVAYANNIRLKELNLTDKFGQSSLTLDVNANFVGNNVDDMNGYLRIESFDFIREDKELLLKELVVETTAKENNHKTLSINSDILNGKIEGTYSYKALKSCFLKTLNTFLPALINEKDIQSCKIGNNLDFNFQIANTEELSNIFMLPITIIDTTTISGTYNNIEDKLKLEVFAPTLQSGSNSINDVNISSEIVKDQLNSQIQLSFINKNNVQNDIDVNIITKDNGIHTNIYLVNEKKKAKGSFDILTNFIRDDEKEPLKVEINFLPSDLDLNNAKWKISKSRTTIDEGKFSVDNFKFFNTENDQSIRINGIYSQNDSKNILKVELREVDLSYIFETLAIDALQFGGAATGDIFISNLEGKPYANTRLDVTEFRFNGTHLGHLNIFSELDDETNKVMMDGLIKSKENKLTSVAGYLDPLKQELSLNFEADSVDISFLSKYTASILNKVEGRGSGKVHLFGDFSNVTVEGKAYIEDAKLGLTFLNTEYSFTDTVYMNKDLIYFNDVSMKDKHGNVAICNGKVVHDFFRDFMYYIDLSANKFLLYDVPETINSLFSGKVYGTGKGSIGGDEREVSIDVSMKTEEHTAVRLNFMEDVINEYSFITYKKPKEELSPDKKKKQEIPNVIQTKSGMDINMNFYIDATPDAVVELVMDPVGGDVIRGSGSGAMQFIWSTKLSPRLYGTYNINRGSYNFTFQKLLERKFSIQEGSNVQFNGDPFDANLDVNAIYRVIANLNDLDQKLVKTTGQSNIPVQCLLNLTGALKQPSVKLDILFPNADPEVQRQIKSLINTEDMINRQVTYLLLLSKFYTPDVNNVEHRTSDFAAVASATLSSQLSNIMSQIDDRWQLGTNIRTSDGDFTSTEIELILSSHLLNDRLIINGNFGYKDDPQTQDAFISDIDLELLLNNSGTWRIKAYNHYNEKYYYTGGKNMDGQSSQTQGIGIMYKKDFDRFKDLFSFEWFKKRKKNKKNKDEQEPEPLKNDSTAISTDTTKTNFVKIKR